MDWLSGLFSNIYGYLKRAIDALTHLKFADIWNFIKKGFDRFYSLLLWYKKNILEPWERFRQNLIRLYNHYVGPFIRMLDTLRGISRILVVFDRKLAAKLDSFLFGLESKLYYPLYAVLKRINAIASFCTAIVTRLGLLDRTLLISSLERDWKSVWRVLLNNGVLPKSPATQPAGLDLSTIQANFKQYCDTGDGPLADKIAQMDQSFQQDLLQLG